jgi:hypothetical protein
MPDSPKPQYYVMIDLAEGPPELASFPDRTGAIEFVQDKLADCPEDELGSTTVTVVYGIQIPISVKPSKLQVDLGPPPELVVPEPAVKA